MNKKLFLAAPAVLLLSGCTLLRSLIRDEPPPAPATPSAPTAAAAPAPAAKAAPAPGAFDDDAHPLGPLEMAVIAAGNDPVKGAATEAELLKLVLLPGPDPVVGIDAARQLGLMIQSGPQGPSFATLEALAPLLLDQERCDAAHLALDRVPGTAVDDLFINAFPHSSGRARLALVLAFGSRQTEFAIPVLAKALSDPEPAQAAAAAGALGRIGGKPALIALESAPRPRDPAVLNARLLAAHKAGSEALARTAATIYHGTDAPLPQRAAALRALLDAQPDQAVAEIDATLRGNVAEFQAVALQAVLTLPAAHAAAELARHVPDYAPALRSSLLAALGRRGDATAVPGVLAALGSDDADTRLAALEALGRLPGNADTARAVADRALGTTPEAKAAFASLARMPGAEVDRFVRDGAAAGDEKHRLLCLQLIAARNLTESVPFLHGLRSDPSDAVRLEALETLRAIAAPSEQGPVIAWALGATARNEQGRATRALVTIILRDDDATTRTDAVVAALATADTAGRLTLFPVISRAGGPRGLAALAGHALGANPAEAAAAVAEIARWPDLSALATTAEIAARATAPETRAAAVRAAVGFYSRINRLPTAEESAVARQLLDVPVGEREKSALLGVLSLCSDEASLAVAKRFEQDAAVAEAAQDAINAIRSNLAGPPAWTASGDQGNLANLSDHDRDTYWLVQDQANQWLRADLHNSRPVRRISLDANDRRGWGYPAHLDIYVSDDPEQPGEVRAQLDGDKVLNVVQLPAGARGRYVWLKQTGTRDAPWTAAEIVIQ